jgi:hypothetical protein
MPEVLLPFPRAWIEFPNPDDEGEVIRADLTWLTSSYTCIFGSGCRGIYATSPSVGCCTLGAHFAGKEDEKRTAGFVAQLTPENWQFHPGRTVRKKDWIELDDEGERKTKTHEVDGEGACVFANRPGFAGGAGCALHVLAGSLGVSHVETKPDVCWQLPLRRAFRTVERADDTSYLEVTITEYERGGWGAGGHDFDWYCTANTEAHVAPEPVFLTHRNELVAMIGEGAYEELVQHCEEHVRSRSRLAIHPATAEASRD